MSFKFHVGKLAVHMWVLVYWSNIINSIWGLWKRFLCWIDWRKITTSQIPSMLGLSFLLDEWEARSHAIIITRSNFYDPTKLVRLKVTLNYHRQSSTSREYFQKLGGISRPHPRGFLEPRGKLRGGSYI